mmetsp:Transcript_136/g.77  ORF Transcript_136/g.77 Transcript_136/m.77 type:complete len:112 (+) Transcript_136:3-338(+)
MGFFFFFFFWNPRSDAHSHRHHPHGSARALSARPISSPPGRRGSGIWRSHRWQCWRRAWTLGSLGGTSWGRIRGAQSRCPRTAGCARTCARCRRCRGPASVGSCHARRPGC